MTDLWSDYWAADQAPDSTAHFPEAERNAIAEAWRSEFAWLPAGARILDVGTGGGGLLALVAEAAHPQRPLSAVGIDLATEVPAAPVDDDPNWSVTFQGGVDAAALPFPDRSFQHVISQFALEYGAFDAAVLEAARVCDGRITLLVHAADGIVVRQNAAIAEQIDWLLREQRLIEGLTDHFQAPSAETANGLKAVGAAMAGRIRKTENPSFLQGLARDLGMFLTAPSGDREASLARVTGLGDALSRHALRMNALADAAVDAQALDDARYALREAGFRSANWTRECTLDGQHVLGYWLRATR